MQIHCLAQHGDLVGVARLLERGVPVDAVEPHRGFTALHRACASDEAGADLVDLLLDAGADGGALGRCDETPLRLAAQCGHVGKLTRLLARGCPLQPTPLGYTPFLDAINHGADLGIIRLLLDAGIDPDAESTHGESALASASWWSRFDVVQLLLDRGADPGRLRWDPLLRAIALAPPDVAVRMIREHSGAFDQRAGSDRPPLLLALERGELPILDALAGVGADVRRITGRCGSTALMHAASADRTSAVDWCLARGADPDATDDFGRTALMKAAGRGALGCIASLLAAGADAEFASPHTGSLAITEAATAAAVALLVAAGSDIDTVDGSGYGLLKSAAESGELAFATALLAAGADPDATSTGDTALHAAVKQDGLELMRRLLAHGATVDARDVDGWTPLFGAQSVEAVRLLLAHGADPACGDDGGMRAREWIARGNEDAARELPA